MNCLELFHTSPESYWPGRFIVAVPAPQAGDDPAGPGEASSWVRVLLPFGLSFQCWDEHFEGFDLGLCKDGGGGQLMFAVAFLYQLYIYTAVSYTHLRAHETGRNLVCR